MTITINIPAAGGGGGGITSITEFTVNDMDETTTTDVFYVGKEDADGDFLILKMDDTGATTALTYALVSNNPTELSYASAWAARVTLTYNRVSEV